MVLVYRTLIEVIVNLVIIVILVQLVNLNRN